MVSLASKRPIRLPLLLLREARPSVQLMFQARFAVGAVLCGLHANGITWRTTLAAAVWSFATMFIYLFNGYADAGEDTANGSRRPVASGLVSPNTAKICAYGCAAAALAGSMVVGGLMPLLTAGVLALGYAYSAPPFALKNRTAGTMFAVSAAGILTYLAPLMITWNGGANLELLTFGIAMSLWMTMVGALVKDLSDIPGDKANGRRTAAIKWGENHVRLLASFSALFVGIALFAVADEWARTLVSVAVVLVLGAIVLAVCTLSAMSYGSRGRRRRPYRVFMVTQYATHAVAVIAHA
jgi:4-hydroxybenzoate polyprenyltransferase